MQFSREAYPAKVTTATRGYSVFVQTAAFWHTAPHRQHTRDIGIRPQFKSSRAARWHSAALGYTLLSYLLGWAGLLAGNAWLFLPAAVLLGHSLVIAAYMIHECAHNTVFKQNRHNAALGTALSWLCGACYGRYEDIRYKHFRHHVDNDDVVWFDYEAFFRSHPRVYAVTRGLEWCYVPAHDYLMHALMMFSAFIIPQRRDQRGRNITVLALRLTALAALLWWQPLAFAGYVLAYTLMIIVLRFMDGIQHDYPYHLRLFSDEVSEHKGDAEWEQLHTFSNVISWRYEWPNWLVLNFGYHNAHHAKPTTPWFELPTLHRTLFGHDPDTVVRLRPQLQMYHRYRGYRIFHDAPGLSPKEGRDFLQAAQRAELTGGNAASFLTAF
ncbi:hypothetical protein GCM10007053_28880 [Halioglobus pacificus]|uniref:Fatty acid desaturase domain-containing protein n=1 Tax=Parahalioglobus pacificus TaxID=930806 RepID=A0A918XM90_9GAMM|nr:hypothetical protein GCM10007053_28880 [Halioglobus pacificus]